MSLLNKVSVKDLVGCAGFLGMGIGIAGLTLYHKKRRDVTRLPFRKQALDILHRNTKAIELLGDPIKICDLNPNETSYDDTVGYMRIPLEGTKRSAGLHVHASKDADAKEWTIESVHMLFDGKVDSKKFLLYSKET